MKNLNSMDLLATESNRKKIESYQMDVLESFRDFNEAVRYHGSPDMNREITLLHNLTFEAVAKSFNQDELQDCIENFVQKLKDLSYFNGYLDVTIESLNHLREVWTNTMFDIQADWVYNGVFEYDADKYELRVNVGSYKFVTGTVNLERILTER